MKGLFRLNIFFAGLFLAGFILEQLTTFTFLRSVAVLPLYFFLPGYNVAFLLFPTILRPLERIIVGFLSSFILVSVSTYAVLLFWKAGLSESLFLSVVLVLCFLTFLVAAISLTSRYRLSINSDRDHDKILWWALLVYAGVLGAIFILYRFIPESDPYVTIKVIGDALKFNDLPGLTANRPLFTVLTASISMAGKMSLGTIVKYVIPILGLTIVLPIYASARQKIKNNFIVFFLTVLPATVPVVMLENVITRSQLFIMLSFPGILYLLSRAITYRSTKLAGFVLALSVILSQFHELSLILIVIALATLAILVWPEAKKTPTFAVSFLVLIGLASYPYLHGLIGMAEGIIHILSARLVPFHFQLWFIDNYVNIDGIQVGWPGISWIYYYYYNLGFVVLGLVVFALISQKKLSKPNLDQLPIVLAAITFLLIAEVLPRVNIAYLPDRAWPFFVLALCLLAPDLIKALELKPPAPTAIRLGILLLFLSFASIGFITYQKQGWVTEKEYKAALFLKNNTPPQSVVVTQGGNGQLVTYYGDRTFVARDIFTEGLPSRRIAERLVNLPKELNETNSLLALKEQLTEELSENAKQTYAASNDSIEPLIEKRKIILDQLAAVEKQRVVAQRTMYPEHPNIYVLYSKDKFKFLYGQRVWWRNLNYANAYLEPFADKEFFSRVYSNSAVTIWQLHY